MQPLLFSVDLVSAAMKGNCRIKRTYLRDLEWVFRDSKAFRQSLQAKDELVYEVTSPEIPEEPGHLCFGISVIHPGRVGDEFYMTKGHFHSNDSSGEIYFCLKGEGYLLMQDREGTAVWERMTVGTTIYVPPHFAHRTINTGSGVFVCFYCFLATAEHDYDNIRLMGFPKRCVAGENGPEMIDS